jgi:acetyl-CoA C-acetyltransferase
MSNAPYYMYGMRNGVKAGDQTLVDGMIKDGLWCSFCDVHMGSHAEYTARKAEITRERQDEFAFASHRKAVAAIEGGKFKNEIVPVQIPGRKGPTTVDTDESPRKDTSLEALAKLRPAFPPKSGSTDGLTIMARITGYATGAMDPQDLFFAPIRAVNNLMEKTRTSINDFDLIEANEAFASQALADGDQLGWLWDRVNVNGGAIALGHPIGASGARVLTTLLYALEDRNKERGLATLCLGGGDAVALSVERVN